MAHVLCVVGVAGVWQVYGEYTTSRQLNIQQYIFTTQFLPSNSPLAN